MITETGGGLVGDAGRRLVTLAERLRPSGIRLILDRTAVPER